MRFRCPVEKSATSFHYGTGHLDMMMRKVEEEHFHAEKNFALDKHFELDHLANKTTDLQKTIEKSKEKNLIFYQIIRFTFSLDSIFIWSFFLTCHLNSCLRYCARSTATSGMHGYKVATKRA